MGIENLVFKKADDTLIIEGQFSTDNLGDQGEALASQMTRFFENDVHKKFGPVTDWAFIHVVVSAPELLPVWQAILSSIHPAGATERIVFREELDSVAFRSHFECIGIVSSSVGQVPA